MHERLCLLKVFISTLKQTLDAKIILSSLFVIIKI